MEPIEEYVLKLLSVEKKTLSLSEVYQNISQDNELSISDREFVKLCQRLIRQGLIRYQDKVIELTREGYLALSQKK